MRYAVYVFDYGAPVGFRLALEDPERITALITQNGNAYEEGIGQVFDPMREYWRKPSAENRSTLRELLESAPCAAAGRLGQERSDFPAGRSRGVQTRHSRCESLFIRNRPLCA
jgi:pimeloyl-ACP methyl ester carboxylesterase